MKLEARDLGLRRGGKLLFRHLDLSLRPGRMLMILGPNGAGKSSLLACLRGALHADEGQVRLDGRPVTELTPAERARRLAFLPQRVPAGGLSVWESILVGRRPHMGWSPRPVDREVCARAATRMGLDELLHRSCSALSGGELQRVALARALAQEARILLLDEAMAALDMRAQIEVFALLRSLADEEGVAICLVSHDLNASLHHGDELLLLGRNGCRSRPPGELDVAELEELYGTSLHLGRLMGRPVVVPRTEGSRS